MDLINRFHLYLYSLGYEVKSVYNKNNTITDYVNAVLDIAKKEKMTVDALAKGINTVAPQYESGAKSATIPQNNKRTISGLNHFKDFINSCNPKSLV